MLPRRKPPRILGWLRRYLTVGLAAAALATPTSAVVNAQTSETVAGSTLRATIRYTEYGIPHILADSYRGLGFGQGYAAARDNLCTMAGSLVTLSGEGSRYFGPDARPRSMLSRATTNLASDLYFAGVNASGVVERLRSRPAPLGPRAEVRELVRGYVAGYNRLLAEGHRTSCSGQPWLRPMTELDLYRRLYALAMVFGQNQAAEAIVAAAPPAAGGDGPGKADPERAAAALAATRLAGPASNAIALGRATTATGRGMAMTNTHFFWHGDLKFWQVHLTIPGRLNVSGAAFLGVPLVAAGYTETMAWAGTATDGATLYALFELKLAPGSPTTYLIDGRPEPMQRRDVTVTVRQPDGTFTTVTRPQWWTRYGPVVSRLRNGLELPWSPGEGGQGGTAYALADPNASNLRLANALLDLDHARRTADVLDGMRRNQGLPWFNTLAADADGHAVYIGPQSVQHITDEHAARCSTELGKRTFDAAGLAVLDGSRSACAWGRDPDAVQAGIFGPRRVPIQERVDYVTNSNNSHWLTNARQPLEGYPRIVGAERAERGQVSPRIRHGHQAIAEQLAAGGFTRKDMERLVFSNRSWAGELTRDDTVALCHSLPDGHTPGSNGPVDVAEACDVLAGWDLRTDTGSRGALLFDRFWRRVWAGGPSVGSQVWKVPFDPEDPVNTPNTLNTESPVVLRALADAVTELRAAGVPLDVPLGERQYTVRGGERFPLGGGTNLQGVYNILEATWDPEQGAYTDVPFGTAYSHVVSFGPDRCPDATMLLSYSQSSDPTSSHHIDQTRLFARKRWITARFCEKDILASPDLEVIRISQG